MSQKEIIKPEHMKKIIGNWNFYWEIAQASGRSHTTIYRWIRSNDPKLCNIGILKTISKLINVPVEELTQAL